MAVRLIALLVSRQPFAPRKIPATQFRYRSLLKAKATSTKVKYFRIVVALYGSYMFAPDDGRVTDHGYRSRACLSRYGGGGGEHEGTCTPSRRLDTPAVHFRAGLNTAAQPFGFQTGKSSDTQNQYKRSY
jgi:hypothetical protein